MSSPMFIALKGHDVTQGLQGIFWKHSMTATGPLFMISIEGKVFMICSSLAIPLISSIVTPPFDLVNPVPYMFAFRSCSQAVKLILVVC